MPTMPHTITTTYEAFLVYLRDVRQRPGNTVRAYRSDLRGAATVLVMPLTQMTFKDIEGYIASTETAASTRQRKSAALSAFFRWAMREGYVDSSPAAMVDHEAVPRGLPRPISDPAHLARIEREMASNPQPFRLIFTLVRETGQRVGVFVGTVPPAGGANAAIWQFAPSKHRGDGAGHHAERHHADRNRTLPRSRDGQQQFGQGAELAACGQSSSLRTPCLKRSSGGYLSQSIVATQGSLR